MKKFVCVLLSLITMTLMAASSAALSASSNIPLETASLNKLLNSFRTAIKNGDKYLSLKEYDLYDDSSRLTYFGLYELLAYNTKDIGSFKYDDYNESYISIELSTDSGYITGVYISYDEHYMNEDGSCNTELLNEDKKIVSERYRKALSVVKKGMTDAEKALALYDYLLTITDYPGSIGAHGTESYPEDSYKAYGLLRDGFSTCLAYSRLYAILLNESGIPAVTVGSDDMNHEWVMACIDGEWYHCDPTWDDYLTEYGVTAYFEPNNDEYDHGAVSHRYFLKSDEEFQELEHTDWDTSYTVNPDRIFTAPGSGSSGKFDDKFFSDKNTDFLCFTAMSCINGNWYFCDIISNSVICTKIDGEPEYIALPDDSESIRYSFPDGNDLYVSTDRSIYRMDTVSDRFEKILEIPPSDNKNENEYTTFSEMSVRNDEMIITTADYIYNDDEDAEEIFTDTVFSTETYPMNEVRNMKAVAAEKEGPVSARRDSTEEKKPSGSEGIKKFSSDTPLLNQKTDDRAEQVRSSSIIYVIVGAIVLLIAAAGVIAALIINKHR